MTVRPERVMFQPSGRGGLNLAADPLGLHLRRLHGLVRRNRSGEHALEAVEKAVRNGGRRPVVDVHERVGAGVDHRLAQALLHRRELGKVGRGVRRVRLVDLELLGRGFRRDHEVHEFGGGVLVLARRVDHHRIFVVDGHDRFPVAHRRELEPVDRLGAALLIVAAEAAQNERPLVPVEGLALRPGNLRRREIDRVEVLDEHAVVRELLHHRGDVDGARIGPGYLVVDQSLVGVEAVFVDHHRRPHELRRPLLLVGQHEGRDSQPLWPSPHSPSSRPRWWEP